MAVTFARLALRDFMKSGCESALVGVDKRTFQPLPADELGGFIAKLRAVIDESGCPVELVQRDGWWYLMMRASRRSPVYAGSR